MICEAVITACRVCVVLALMQLLLDPPEQDWVRMLARVSGYNGGTDFNQRFVICCEQQSGASLRHAPCSDLRASALQGLHVHGCLSDHNRNPETGEHSFC